MITVTPRVNTELINEFMKTHHMTKTAFAKASGISSTTLNKLLTSDMTITIKSVYSVAHILGVSVTELVQDISD